MVICGCRMAAADLRRGNEFSRAPSADAPWIVLTLLILSNLSFRFRPSD